MKRSELRERIFRMLFRVEFHPKEDLAEQETLFLKEEESNHISPGDEDYIRNKYEQILSKLDEIDSLINEKTLGWDTSRIAKADLAVIRLAVYEILYDDDVPTSVAINEAVELSRRFGQDDSPSFVNGVLAKFA